MFQQLLQHLIAPAAVAFSPATGAEPIRRGDGTGQLIRSDVAGASTHHNGPATSNGVWCAGNTSGSHV